MLVVTLGALKKPLLEILPKLVDQFTAVLLVPCTVAVNCCVPPDPVLRLVGEIARLMFEGCAFPWILIDARSLVLLPVESVTVIEKALVIGQSGVPLIAPVRVFRAIFLGNIPRVTEKL